MDGRKARDNELFRQVYEQTNDSGFTRTIEQIKNRWKFLKSAYRKAKSQNGKSGSDPSTFPFYDIMDEFMGDRPLANTDENGVDVGFADDLPAEEDTLENVNEDSSSEEYADQITSDNSDTAAQKSTFASGISSSVQSDDGREQTSGASRKRPGTRVSSRYDKAMRIWSTEQQSFLEKMQEAQNVWMEKQLERSQQREERLLAKLVEETSRSNERLVGQLLSGLSSIFSQTTSTPPFTQGGTAQFQYSHLQPRHPYPDGQNVHRSQNTPSYSDTDSYTFMNI